MTVHADQHRALHRGYVTDRGAVDGAEELGVPTHLLYVVVFRDHPEPGIDALLDRFRDRLPPDGRHSAKLVEDGVREAPTMELAVHQGQLAEVDFGGVSGCEKLILRGELTAENERDFHVAGAILDSHETELTTAVATLRKRRNIRS